MQLVTANNGLHPDLNANVPHLVTAETVTGFWDLKARRVRTAVTRVTSLSFFHPYLYIFWAVH